MSDEERQALIFRMQYARTDSEIRTAMDEAWRWLRSHPADDRVAAAMQRLEERDERMRDTESETGWIGVAAAVLAGLAVGAAVYLISESWTYSIAAALFIGLEFGFWGWEIVAELFEKIRRDRSDNGGE